MTRVAVVTGGASGMGRGIALRLAADGNAVAVLDLDADAAAATAKDIEAAGGKALAAAVDVSDRTVVDAAMDRVRADLGPIGIIVTSAGFDTFESFTDITPELWTRMLEVNLTGTFHCIQSAIPDMLDAGWGRIVTISSSSAQSGANRMAHYVASKGGVIALTKALAVEYRAERHHGQHDPSGIHRHSDGAPRRSARRPAEHRRGRGAHARPARGHARRHRGRVRVPLLGGSRLRHRSGAQRERRLVPVTDAVPPRVAPVAKEAWDDDMRAALAHAFPEPVVERLLSTEPGAMEMPGAIATFMQHPALAGPFLAYNQMLLGKSAALAPRDRELVILRVAWRTRSRYEWYQHVRLAPRVHLSDEELAAIAEGAGAALWSARDADLLAATDQLIDGYRVDDATWEQLAGALDTSQLVELVFVVGTYTGLAMAFNSFGLQLDAELDDIVAQHPQFDQYHQLEE